MSTPFGFVILAALEHKAWVSAYNKEGALLWKIILHNNGPLPDKKIEQIDLFDTDGSVLYGTSAMYDPHNGRLIYARGRVIVAWAHYNYFGLKDGKRNDHTGCTLISVDSLNGNDIKPYFGFFPSHSLN